jgi:hypothetical protein
MTDENRKQQTDLGDLYRRLIKINEEAFAGEHYDIAYHALSGAFYCAQPLKNIQQIGK